MEIMAKHLYSVRGIEKGIAICESEKLRSFAESLNATKRKENEELSNLLSRLKIK